MVHGAVRSLFQLLGALVAGLLIALPVLAWRLSEGPVALDFLTPYIEEALTAKESAVAVRLGRTVLAMGRGQRLMELRAEDVRAYSGGDKPIAVVPEMVLALNGRALLLGVLAPNSVRLVHPQITLVRDASGALQLGGIGAEVGDGSAADVVPLIRDALMGKPDPAKPGRHLQSFAIEDAVVTVEDRSLGTTWKALEVDLRIRRVDDGLAAEGLARLEVGGEPGRLDLKANYHHGDDAADAELQVEGIRLASFSRLSGQLAQLAALDLPLAGTVRGRATLDGRLDGLSFDLSGGRGQLILGQPLPVRYDIAKASLKGRVSPGLTRLDLDELFVDLGGPTATVTAVADGLGGATTLKAEAVLRNTPVNSVAQLWPKGLADNARDWVVPNLSNGFVPEARLSFAGRSPSGAFDDLAIDHLSGEIRPEGVTVDYLHPMPPAKNVSAICTFDAKSFHIQLKSGEVYGLRLKEGALHFLGLDVGREMADFELVIGGPATDGLKLIDHQPLGFASALGIDPAVVGGEAMTRTRLKFPLEKSLTIDRVQVNSHAVIKNARVPNVLMGLDLADGTLDLQVDGKGLDATGPVVLGATPAELKWRENFGRNVPFRSRYQVTALKVDEAERKRLGLDFPPFVAPYVAGPVGAQVVATLGDGGKGEIDARMDLLTASMELPNLGWKKEAGKPATAEASVRLERKLVAAVPRFAVRAGDLDVRGHAAFDGEGRLTRVEFQRAAFGRTDGEGSLTFHPGRPGFDVAFKGPSFDARPLIASDKNPDAPPRNRQEEEKLPPMAIAASVKTLWLSEQGSLSNATVAMQRNAEDWRNVSVKGGLGQGKTFTAVLQPAGPKRRALAVLSDDAGATFRAFDLYNDMSGGRLEVQGQFDDTKDTQPLSGTMTVGDYHVRNVPALARLLTVAALTGIVDLLQGEGVSFSSLEAPFTLVDGLMEIRDGRAYGPALGITARGQIDVDRGRLALEGTVVPAYAINSVLGKIPVLGWLVTGGEKGGGFLAFNYGMKGSTADPDVTVNPLSVLTPGFLRNLFNIFGSDTEARKPEKPPEKKPE